MGKDTDVKRLTEQGKTLGRDLTYLVTQIIKVRCPGIEKHELWGETQNDITELMVGLVYMTDETARYWKHPDNGNEG